LLPAVLRFAYLFRFALIVPYLCAGVRRFCAYLDGVTGGVVDNPLHSSSSFF
jgi:hypothetical protein